MKIGAIHFENFVFILLVIGAYLFQFLTSAATKARKRDQTKRTSTTTPPPVPRAAAETGEERVRKFLEALGQPTTTTPPPRRRSFSPPSSPLPPLKTQPPELPREIKSIATAHEKKIFTPRVAQAPAFEVHESPPTSEPTPLTRPEQADPVAIKSASTSQQPATDVVALLRSASGLRDAIVLREIFGPPRCFQPLDMVGSV